jgi:RNA polymerase sigma factor (sigma-70 family)
MSQKRPRRHVLSVIDPRTPSDAQLLRAASRNADAFVALYDRYATSAVTWARRGGVPEADVMDLVAELFAQAWKSRRRYRDPGDGDAGGWLYGIAGHLIKHYHRRGQNETRARRRLRLPLDHQGDEAARADERLDALADSPKLEAALIALPAGQQRAVRLRVVDGLTYSDVATQLSCTPTAARKRVSLGLRALRAQLEQETT